MRSRPLLPWMACAVLAAGAAGCAQLGPRGAPMGGLEGLDAGRTLRATPRTSAPSVVTSTYEQAPFKAWSRFAIGRPHSLVGNVGSGMGLTRDNCTLTPNGISRVLPIAEGAPTTTLLKEGGLEYGLAGVPLTAADETLESSPTDLALRMMERNAYLSTTGDGCNRSVFAFVRLDVFGGSPSAVAISRE